MKFPGIYLSAVRQIACITKFKLAFAAILLSAMASGQVTYTLGNGTTSNATLGVNPFATINVNSRSQYLYLAQELIDQGATSGNIVSMAINITVLGLPTSLKPENVTIRLGSTEAVTLGTTLIEGLPVYYTAESVNITQTGWHTLTFAQPFEWDGLQNIIVEICRSNDEFGTSYEVQTSLYNVDDYRSVGLYSNSTSVAGCDLTGQTPMTGSNRRMRPNAQFTMTMPCAGSPDAGITAVTDGLYCSGEPFTLSVENGSEESGLAYQWQASPNGNGLWENIPGANNATLSITQSIATYYRRSTTCIASQQSVNSLAVFVSSDGCYCNAQVTNENAIGLTNVSFAQIDNSTTSTSLYNNFTNIQTEVTQGSAYELSARVTTDGQTVYTKAWIDWNRDAVYDESESYLLGSVSSGTNVSSGATVSVAVPLSALVGSTTMRVRSAVDPSMTYAPSCGAVLNGETEDYRIIVNELLSVNDPESGVSILAYAAGGFVNIKSQGATLSKVSVFDISGRRIASVNADGNLAAIPMQIKDTMVILRIETADGATVNKKIIL